MNGDKHRRLTVQAKSFQPHESTHAMELVVPTFGGLDTVAPLELP